IDGLAAVRIGDGFHAIGSDDDGDVEREIAGRAHAPQPGGNLAARRPRRGCRRLWMQAYEKRSTDRLATAGFFRNETVYERRGAIRHSVRQPNRLQRFRGRDAGRPEVEGARLRPFGKVATERLDRG